MVHIVGAGIGDAGLVTVKAVKCIQAADVILYDHLANPSLLAYAKDGCKLIYAGKTAKKHSLEQEEINACLVRYGAEYDVVRLKGGDPFVFGRGGEEIAELVKNGIGYEVVPGVSSSYAAAAYAGIPVTHRGTVASFHVITGHERQGGTSVDYVSLAGLSGTLVFLMGLGAAREISQRLIQNGKDPKTGAAIISRASTEKQQAEVGTLEELPEMAKRLKPPAVIVVGDVVSFQNEWYRPSGARIITTGTRAMNERIKDAFGDIPITEISLIRTVEINHDKITDIKGFSHIAFTSAVGVRTFFRHLRRSGIDIRQLGSVKYAVVGKGTASALEEYGVFADIMPEVQSSAALAEELLKQDCERVLVIRAENGSDIISQRLKDRAYDLPLYRTEADITKKELLDLCLTESDYVIFSSGSAVRAYAQMRGCDASVKHIAIGKETAAAAGKCGIEIYKIAKTADADGIARCILEDMENDKAAKTTEDK